MAVYYGERPEFLDQSLRSLVDQTVLPEEIILVLDGFIPSSLSVIIKKYQSLLPIKTVQLPKNKGLANALSIGLKHATYDWVMRFDTDDICTSDRIKKQLETIKNYDYDVFGSQIIEFDGDLDKIIGIRRVPTEHSDIRVFSKIRNPFNHMTVCFKKNLVLEIGGYPQLSLMEDYALWIMLISRGARCANSDEVLVYARAGTGLIKRRGGLGYVASEIRLQKLMYGLNYKSLLSCFFDGVARSLIFLSFTQIRGFFYRRFLRG